MIAVVVTVTIDAGKEEEAEQRLREGLVPMLKATAGFVAGYWFEPEGNTGRSIVFFESEEQARAVVPPVGGRPPGVPVTIETVELRGVIASA